MPPLLPDFSFTYDPSLSPFTVPMSTWLSTNNNSYAGTRIHGIATSTVVFNASTDKILLLRRSLHDSMPGLWEPPGGSVDPTDETILHAAARELWEEGGLKAKHFKRVIELPDRWGNMQMADLFSNRTGSVCFCRFMFEIEVDEREFENVKVDPEEHSEYVWADEQRVKGLKTSGDGQDAMPYIARVLNVLFNGTEEDQGNLENEADHGERASKAYDSP